MTHHDARGHEPAHTHEPAGHTHEPEPTSGLTAFALVKYGFILVITIVVLYFLARYIIPMF